MKEEISRSTAGMKSVTDAEIQEMFSVLFHIVRTNLIGLPIGHDVMAAACSIVRRLNPDAYGDMVRRRNKAGLDG